MSEPDRGRAENRAGAVDSVSAVAGKKLTRALLAAAVAALVIIFLLLLRHRSYLLFHSVVEIFSVVIAVGVFMIAWNSRKVLDNNYLLFVGIAFAFVASVDVLHALSYYGMGVFSGNTANLSTQLWITARCIQSFAFLAAPFFLGRRMRPWLVVACFTVITGLALLSIFSLDIFPTCYVPGRGLTHFKEVSEYVISAALIAGEALLWLKREFFERGVLWMLEASLILNVAAEVAFTLYTQPYAAANFVGHVLKVFSFYLIYKAIIVTGLERPVDLLFRSLKTSEERLKRANLELEGYANTVSHDMRAPLASIKLASQMLDELINDQGMPPESKEEMQDYIASISRGTDKSFELVEDLLALAKAGQKPERGEPVDINDLVAGIIAERRGELEAKGARVVVKNELGTVTGSRTQLYQVFSNLLSNAIRHGRQSGTVVEISRLESSDGVNRYRLCDNGPGIPPEIANSLFNPFVKGPGGGTGIGLATVQRIVTAYGGEIKAYNSGGACFEFSLREPEITSRTE